MEIGVFTFADTRQGEEGAERRLRDLMEEVELADEVDLEVFGVGEHHRPDFAVSTPAVVLAAAAARTQLIRLTSAVTVLSSTTPSGCSGLLDRRLLSGGRAEIMVAEARSSSRSSVRLRPPPVRRR
jgi:alkanesulfonate monooxygenase SsuD/methylene tetrahydromethanopterin reductase-like flavin-dependent oxidoreductase (luciferase family)